MSARDKSLQNETSTSSRNVTDNPQSAGGEVPTSSSSSSVAGGGMELQLAQPHVSSLKGTSMGSGDGELVKLSSDTSNIQSLTPHSSPVPPAQTTPLTTDITPNSTPSSSPRRPLGISSEPPAKRIKIEEKPTDTVELRKLIIEWKTNKLESIKEKYNNNLVEKFFLENVGNLMDYQSWCRRPARDFLNYIHQHKLEGDDSLEAKFTAPSPFQFAPGGVQIKTESTSAAQSTPIKSNMGNLARTSTSPVKSGKGLTGNAGRQKTLSSSSDNTTMASQQDQMVEKARQEAYVMQRIAALRKEGLWSEKRLPKVHEPPRPKAHWDYLLEEMVWLSADFAQERKWKKAAAKKCARMVQKYFMDKALQAQKEEKEKEMRTRKIAAFIAKEVRTFWGNTEKFIQFKITTKLDEKKKKALDQQLSFIVDQTEKYSSWLAESMNKPAVTDSTAVSTCTTPSQDARMSDEEFQPEESSDDDEGTIAKEDDNPEEQVSELQLLQKESEQTIEDLLKDLPEEYFQDLQESNSNTTEQASEDEPQESDEDMANVEDKESVKKGKKRKAEPDVSAESGEPGDEDFKAEEPDEDDENTIEEQEANEQGTDHLKELEELQAENEMSVEELRRKYAELAANAEPMEKDSDDESSNEDEQSGDDDGEEDISDDDGENKEHEEGSEEEDEEMPSDEENEEDMGLGLEMLMEDDLEPKGDREKADKELQDASAAAEALQPKGFTLSSTSVTTPVPFLLKHTLREYQHVGLDWLTTMYDKKLNGILADEMGLGKTIQTISLLAHLACEKRNWGPHLIVVPTSVMLNWEMEFKKWCPAFKILTYYGTQKERKMKRQGWTKPNAFHICITSYKLVIQDHQSFRRKKWKYFILDEAQNIKNFKSQRWQLLLNFQSQRRLLLTGTPLQNNLMELWSLMHFLMPNVFASHREFREWFSNPVTGMIEGNKEYNENIIKRLHKVLRPFILRRLKTEVEQQMPKKFEHVVMCRLSKRQRYLYEEFMSRTKTKETLASGNFLSVINVLMQLRKVCNHPNLFEPRPTISPFITENVCYEAPSLVWGITDYDPFKHIDLFSLNLLLADLELCLTAFAAHRIRKFQASRRLIEEIDSASDPPPKCPAGKIKLHVRPSSQSVPKQTGASPATTPRAAPAVGTVRPPTLVQTPTLAAAPTGLQASGGMRFQLVQQGGTIKAIQVPASSSNIGSLVIQQTPQGPRLMMPQRTNIGTPAGTATVGTAPATGGLQLLQTASGQLLLTTAPVQKPTAPTLSQGISGTAAAALLQRLQSLKGLQGSTITTGAGGRPVLRLPLPANTLRPHTQQIINAAQNVPASPLRNPGPATSTAAVSAATILPTTTASPTILRPSTPSASPRTSANNTPTKPTTRTEQKEIERLEEKRKEDERKRSLFFLNDLDERRKRLRKEKLSMISRLNIRKCHACPIYGADLIEAVTVMGNVEGIARCHGNYAGQGTTNCLHATHLNTRSYWTQTDGLHKVVRTPERCLRELKDITDRFIFVVPAVIAPPPKMRICHPPPSKLWGVERTRIVLKQELMPKIAPLHHITNACVTQFPDPRLIQYDCGKLQTLDRLLRQLKTGSHRVLIFTQMTRMLDIFEAFLNYHGHLYLRLDGTTRVEQRQVLMERFNQDKRIFAFILSTRSGGIGVNLTGADTVIFYDSDWNPTMDAQAQDRCHRIGQTRDVHIYRLISEKTIEENILKKANQKRLLGDLAIEGGNFTTAHFKKSTIQDLFDVNVNENDAVKRMSEVLDKKQSQEEGKEAPEGQVVVGAFESALAAAEDETDVQAAKTAKAEAAAELAEFDENLPLNDEDREGGEEISKAEQEVALLMKQLTPVELYAIKFLESREDYQAEAERMSAEIEQQKKEWELGRLQALKEEEERLAQNSDEDLLTYSSSDAHNQMWLSLCGREEMPVWHPPTPPRDENDLYIDHSLGFWYDSSIMPESALPPFYIKKENKRIKIEPGSGGLASDSMVGLRRVTKHRREDAVYAPRSLFDRPSPAIIKIRRDLKLQKYRGIVRPSIPLPGKPPSLLTKPPIAEPENAPEWTINEDWAVVQALQQHLQLELPINLLVLSPGHTPNWDLVADLVNSVSRCFRSSRHCRSRYENTVLPREEGKLPPDTPTKKITKKQKSGLLSKPLHKSSQPMRTSQLFREDNNSTCSNLHSSRFETIKSIAIKRTPTTKPPLINSTHKNPKHAQVLAESGIQYDSPLSPGQVAANLAERIQRAKQKSQAAAELAQQQKLLQLQQQQQQHQAQLTANQLQQQLQQQTQQGQSQPQTSQQQQTQQNTQQVSVVGNSGVQQVVSSGLTTKVATSVVLSQGPAMTVATVTATSSASTPATSTPAAAILGGVRTAVGTTGSAAAGRTTLSLQELQVRTTGTNQGTVVSVASLSQLQAAKLTATLASQSTAQKGRQLTPAQLQYLKQQAQARQALALQQQQQGKVVAGDQTIKRVQIGGQSGTTQKVQVAVSGGALASVNAIQVSQAGRTQLVKPGTVVAGTSGVIGGGKAVTRTVTDREVAALLKQQQQLGKTGQMTQVQVPSAQLLAGLQVQGGVSGGGTPVATLVKTVSAPSSLVHTPTCVTLPVSAINVTLPQARVTTAATVTKAGTAQQTVKHIPLHQQLLAKPRSLVKGPVGLQLGSKAVGGSGLSTVQIVQGGSQKQMSHVTVQQIQQVLKQVPQQSIHHITQGGTVSGTVVGKAVAGSSVSGTSVATSGTQGITTSHTTKLVPMTVSSHQQQPIKQTIQVVSAGSNMVGGGQAIRVSAGERSTSSTLALQTGTVKVTNPAILSQVSAALQGQPMSVAVRTPTQSPVRIQTSALQTQQTTQTQQQTQQTQQGQQQSGGNSSSAGGQ